MQLSTVPTYSARLLDVHQSPALIFMEALQYGCSLEDACQAYEIALEGGIEPLPADEDYAPNTHETNDVY